MRQKETQLEDNLLELTIKDGGGSCRVVFDPTDATFVEKLFHVFDALDAKQQDMEARIRDAQPREVFAIAREADAEVRSLLDAALGEGTCAALWGEINAYAYAGGLPKWANLLIAVMDECDESFTKQQELTRPRLEKYTAKYARKR